MRVTEVENTLAWVVVGVRDARADLHRHRATGFGREIDWADYYVECTHDVEMRPGTLVTSYEGDQKHRINTGLMGLGIVVAMRPHPHPLGDRKYMCTVLWNF